jgi:hypothetical protein
MEEGMELLHRLKLAWGMEKAAGGWRVFSDAVLLCYGCLPLQQV